MASTRCVMRTANGTLCHHSHLSLVLLCTVQQAAVVGNIMCSASCTLDVQDFLQVHLSGGDARRSGAHLSLGTYAAAHSLGATHSSSDVLLRGTRPMLQHLFRWMPLCSCVHTNHCQVLSQVPWAHKYLAGWGYMLSADVALHVVGRYLRWKVHPEEAPGWYPGALVLN